MNVAARCAVRAGALALSVLLGAGSAAGAGDDLRAPTPVVERILDVQGRQVRTTLFSNGVVVVSVRRDGRRVFFRQVELSEDEYLGYLAALQRDATELAAADSLPSARGSGGRGTVTLHVGPKAPLIFGYSSMEVYDLTTTRLLGTLDDLEYQVMFREPTGAGIEGWEPAPGDVVSLRSGQRATVVEVAGDGTLILEHDVTHIREIVPADQRKHAIYEVVVEP
jgi:hypothetical protein